MRDTAYYNYYNIPYRYTPDTPKTPAWKEELKVVKDQVKSNNHDPKVICIKHVRSWKIYIMLWV